MTAISLSKVKLLFEAPGGAEFQKGSADHALSCRADTLTLKYHNAHEEMGEVRTVQLLFDKIAWPTDRRVKFKNPAGERSSTAGESSVP